jgi:hypothetical protein
VTAPPPPLSWLRQHNAATSAVIYAADVRHFVSRELGDDGADDEKSLDW